MSTTVIKLPNIDSKIWNIEYKTIELIKALSSGLNVRIHLNHEGPCATSLGLYRWLDVVCKEFQIDPSRISIYSANPLERNTTYRIVNCGKSWLLEYQNINVESNKTFDESLKHFGIFIGRSNWNRLFLASTIFKNFREKSLISFHYNIHSNAASGFDDLALLMGVAKAETLSNPLLMHFPLALDDIKQYPIIGPEHLNILKYYKDIFLDVVCETYFTGNTFFPTEKTVRPIISKTPFLLFGPKNYLANLRKLGFETFNDYWSEEYDNYSDISRAQKIENILVDLSKKTVSELQSIYVDMIPKLEHNNSVLRNLSADKFFNTFKNE